MDTLFASIVKHASTLIENQYGNYVNNIYQIQVQKKLQIQLKKEKCFRHSTNELKQGIHTKDWTTIIVRELLTKAGDLISDKYGNYCLQTALQVATDHQCLLQEIKKAIKPHLDTLRENVKDKWVKLLESAMEKQKKRNAMPMNMPQGPTQLGMNQNSPNRGNMNNNNNNNNQGPSGPPPPQQQQQQMNQNNKCSQFLLF